MAKLYTNGSMPTILNGHELLYVVRNSILESHKEAITVIEGSFESNIILIQIECEHEEEKVLFSIEEVMENFFACTNHHVRHQKYKNSTMYRLELPEYIINFFRTHKW